MPEKKITFPFTVEPFQEDVTGHLSWSNLGNFILRSATLHAEAHGFGHTFMKATQHGWVLSRFVLDITHMPSTDEPYNITTWVTRAFRQFTDRNFHITDANGQTLGWGLSTWALIDYVTRQPVQLDTLPDSFREAMCDEMPPIPSYGRARCKATEPCTSRDCRYSDLDINGHVNSIRYIDMAMDAFSKDWHTQHPLRRIELAYGLEGHEGDHLEIFKDDLGPSADGTSHQFAIEIRRPADNATLVRALLAFN